MGARDMMYSPVAIKKKCGLALIFFVNGNSLPLPNMLQPAARRVAVVTAHIAA